VLSQAPVAAPLAADSLHRALQRVFSAPEYQWIERRPMATGLARLWQRLQDWLNHLSNTYPTGFDVVLVLLVVALVALLVHIGYVMWHIVRPAARTATRATAFTTTIVMDARAHLALGEDLARSGRYAEALAHCFVAAVLELDKRKALRFHPSKTPAEYVAEARLDAKGRAALAGLVAQLYRHLFGAIPCDEYEYRSFGETAQELARGPHVVPA
jgi:hypothetical protein